MTLSASTAPRLDDLLELPHLRVSGRIAFKSKLDLLLPVEKTYRPAYDLDR